MTEIERFLSDLGLEVEVVHEGGGPRCAACEPGGGAVRLPTAA